MKSEAKSLHLAIESSNVPTSVALLDGEKLLGQTFVEQVGKSAQLALHVQNLLKENNITIADLKFISVGLGPGSYTGLRVGLSLAKGLCFPHNTPLYGIDSLHALVKGYQIRNKLSDNVNYVPAFDARKMRLYCANYSSKLQLINATNVFDLKTSEISFIRPNTLIISPHTNSINDYFNNSLTIDTFTHEAHYVGLLGLDKHSDGASFDSAYLTPLYLRNNYV